MATMKDEELYRGHRFWVERETHDPRDGKPHKDDVFRVLDMSSHRIIAWMYALETAVGIAKTFDALIPEGSMAGMGSVLHSLRNLVGARYLFAELIEQEAATLGEMQSRVQEAAMRMYGKRI